MLVGNVVRTFGGLGAFFGIAVISAGACSDDEASQDEASQGGSPATSGMGGEAGQSNETGGGGAGATQGGRGNGGSSGRAGGTQGGGTSGAGGQSTVECTSASSVRDVNDQPCARDGARCEMGEECCCGECQPEKVCRCSEGRWDCGWTDFCMDPMCGGAGGLGGGGVGGVER